jgi:mRNA interferase MazF
MTKIHRSMVKRGELWYVSFSPQVGSEVANDHPALVLSSDDLGYLPHRQVVPITSWQQKFDHSGQWYMVKIVASRLNGLDRDSAANVTAAKQADIERFRRRIGVLEADIIEDVITAFLAVVGAI